MHVHRDLYTDRLCNLIFSSKRWPWKASVLIYDLISWSHRTDFQNSQGSFFNFLRKDGKILVNKRVSRAGTPDLFWNFEKNWKDRKRYENSWFSTKLPKVDLNSGSYFMAEQLTYNARNRQISLIVEISPSKDAISIHLSWAIDTLYKFRNACPLAWNLSCITRTTDFIQIDYIDRYLFERHNRS